MPHTQDDGFHEIQLNGKQLVFLFMAATVVSVVIFLIGVLFGRELTEQRMAQENPAVTDEAPRADAAATVSRSPVVTPEPESDPTKAPPPPPAADFGSVSRFDRDEPPVEEPGPATSAPVAPAFTPQKQDTRAAVKPAPAPAARPATSAPPGPGTPGFVVQVAALNARGEADVMVRRYASKGYQAYVQTPANGAPSVYRVRVGPFKTRREAETAAGQLRKEGLNPWITQP